MTRGFIDGCEQEQLHRSGAIQPHGALLGFDDAGRITHASANLSDVLGHTAEAVLGDMIDILDPGVLAGTGGGRETRGSVTHGGRRFDMRTIACADPRILVELIPAQTDTANVAKSVVTRSRPPADDDELAAAQQSLVSEIARRTGYHRVLYYAFHRDDHGEVIAEARNGDTYGSYRGLHFPASDIPAVARALYLQNPWRLIPDATAEPVAVLGLTDDKVDLTRSDLRSVSEVHRNYLANMGVRSALSFPVAAGDTLHALVSCHHSRARQPDVGLLGELSAMVDAHAVALLSFRAAQRMRLVDGLARRFRDIEQLATAATTLDDIWPVLGPRLLGEFAVDGALLCVDDTVYAIGECFDDDTLAGVERGGVGFGETVWHSDSLRRDIAGLPLTPVAGAAGVAIDSVVRQRIRLWLCRAEHIDEVSWGGNPDKPLEPGDGGAPISPRRSFEAWVERRLGYSRPWTTETELLLYRLRGALRPLGERAWY